MAMLKGDVLTSMNKKVFIGLFTGAVHMKLFFFANEEFFHFLVVRLSV